MREALEAQIQDLNISLQNTEARVEKERLCKERYLVGSRVTSEIWEEKCQEAENTQEWAQHWKDRFDSLQRENLD